MFHLNPLALAQRSALPLALFCVIGSQSATAATAGLCHYLTTTTFQNATGHDLQLTSQNATKSFSIQPAIPTTWILATGGVIGLSQTWGNSSQHDMGGQLVFQINDGQTNPKFQLGYWNGTGKSSPNSVGDAAAIITQQTAEEIAKDEATKAAMHLAEIAVPPPADAIIAAIGMLKFFGKVAKDIAAAFQALGYMNINQEGGGTFASVGVSTDTNQTQVVAIPGTGGSYYNGYVVSTVSVNNGCPNSWNVLVNNYCAYVCGYASGNSVPVADTGCLTSAYCSTLSSNPLPSGSYTTDCRDIKWNGSTLEAKCKTDLAGVETKVSLDYYKNCPPYSGVGYNGQLYCE